LQEGGNAVDAGNNFVFWLSVSFFLFSSPFHSISRERCTEKNK
jgi:hypothetical protein